MLYGRYKIIKLLVDRGVDAEAVEKNRVTALARAVGLGASMRVLERLENRKMDDGSNVWVRGGVYSSNFLQPS